MSVELCLYAKSCGIISVAVYRARVPLYESNTTQVLDRCDQMPECNLQRIGASSNRLSCGLCELLVSEADSMIDEGVRDRYVPTLLRTPSRGRSDCRGPLKRANSRQMTSVWLSLASPLYRSWDQVNFFLKLNVAV